MEVRKHIPDPDGILLAAQLKKCGYCECGGGSCSNVFFKELKVRYPELTVDTFTRIAAANKRNDIVSYMNTWQIKGLFIDIEMRHLEEIAFLLDMRSADGFGWHLFAGVMTNDMDKMIFSNDDIKLIRNARSEPDNWSPTMQVLEIVQAQLPHFSLASLQIAASNINRNDAAVYIKRCIMDINSEH